jgi:hypothetical protein
LDHSGVKISLKSSIWRNLEGSFSNSGTVFYDKPDAGKLKMLSIVLINNG